MKAAVFDLYCIHVSEIGAVVKAMDSQLCGRSAIPDKSCSFLTVLGLSLRFMCSDQYVKYWMPRGIPEIAIDC